MGNWQFWLDLSKRLDVTDVVAAMMRGNHMNKEAALEKIFDINNQYANEIKYVNEKFCTTGENGVLYRLFINGGQLSSGMLAESLSLTSGRIANILKSLERKGLVQRERSADDRRHVIAILTDQGKDKIKDLFSENDQIITKVLENVDIQKLWEALTILEKSMGNIKRWLEEN